MIENGDVAMDPIEGSDKGTIERRTAHGLSGRRAAIKKLALGAGAAGAVWAALWRALKQPSPLSSKGPPHRDCAQKRMASGAIRVQVEMTSFRPPLGVEASGTFSSKDAARLAPNRLP